MRFWSFAVVLVTVSALAQQTIKVTVSNNVVMVPVRVNGRDLRFLFDTGSERSAMDTTVAARLSFTFLNRSWRLGRRSLAACGSSSISAHRQYPVAAGYCLPPAERRRHRNEKRFRS